MPAALVCHPRRRDSCFRFSSVRRPSRNRHRFRGARPRQEAVAADDADGERRHVLRGEGGRGPDGAAGGPELGVRPGARRSSREGRATSRTTCRRWRPTPTTTTTTGTPTPAEPVTSTEPPPRPTPIPAQGNASSQEARRTPPAAASTRRRSPRARAASATEHPSVAAPATPSFRWTARRASRPALAGRSASCCCLRSSSASDRNQM